MPRQSFFSDLRRSAGADVEHILRLADRYDVSKEAAARRYVDLHDEPLAVVFSHNGVVRYPYRSQLFPYVDVFSGAPLPLGCRNASARNSPSEASEWASVDSGIWLSADARPRVVLEQTLAQAEGYCITLLALDDEAEEDDDDETDLQESWAVRFRRR